MDHTVNPNLFKKKLPTRMQRLMSRDKKDMDSRAYRARVEMVWSIEANGVSGDCACVMSLGESSSTSGLPTSRERVSGMAMSGRKARDCMMKAMSKGSHGFPPIKALL